MHFFEKLSRKSIRWAYACIFLIAILSFWFLVYSRSNFSLKIRNINPSSENYNKIPQSDRENLEWFFDNEAGDNYSDLAKEKTSPSRREWDWKRDAVAQSIANSKPSILALQDVDNRRVLWYLTRALTRNHKFEYHELGIESRDHFTEQDVGFLFRPPVDALTVMQGIYPKRRGSTNQYFDLSKHIRGVFEFQHGETTETVTVLNIHLRARPETADKRIRQARSLHHWIASAIGRGQNAIALGDFNTEFRGNQPEKESDIGIAGGLETANTDDDLIDLNLRLPASERAIHLMGGQYDRILCSRSLIEDDPTRPDLVLAKLKFYATLLFAAIKIPRNNTGTTSGRFQKMSET